MHTSMQYGDTINTISPNVWLFVINNAASVSNKGRQIFSLIRSSVKDTFIIGRLKLRFRFAFENENRLNNPSEGHASSLAWRMTAKVTVDSIVSIAAWLIDRIAKVVVRRVVRQLVCGVTGCVGGSVAALLRVLRGHPRFQGRLGCQSVGRRVGATNQAEERGAVPESPGHAGGEKPSTRVTELIEDQHEEDADGVGHQQLQDQQRGADQLVEVSFIDVPQQEQRGILHKTQHIVHGHAIPVLGFVDEIWVVELHLHGRPAEHVDAGVEEGEEAEHDGGSHPGQGLLDVLWEGGVAQPEQDPGVEKENQEVQQNHRQDPELQHGAEQNQNCHAGGNLKASPQENAQIRHGPDVNFVVVIFDLNGQDVAA